MIDSAILSPTSERIVGQARLTAPEISAFASMCGDYNPLHLGKEQVEAYIVAGKP